jgi:anti-anti-sigma factor
VVPYANTVLEQGRTVIIVLNRCLDLRERNVLSEAWVSWGEPSPQTVFLDLSRLERINVVTVSAMLRLHELLSKNDRSLRLCGLRSEVYEALHYLGLHRLIPVEARAVASK